MPAKVVSKKFPKKRKQILKPRPNKAADKRANEEKLETAKALGLDLMPALAEPSLEGELNSRLALGIVKIVGPSSNELQKNAQPPTPPEILIRTSNPCTQYESYKPIDVVQFCEDKDYLGIKLLSVKDYPKFEGKISQKELLWKFCMEKSEDGKRKWKELVLSLGMRGTKTTTVALMELYEVYLMLLRISPQEAYGLLPRQEIFFNNVAGSHLQGKDTVFAKLEEFIPTSPWFQKYTGYLREKGTDSEGKPWYKVLETGAYEFRDKNITLRNLNSNSGGQVGKTAKVVVFDELARMKTTDGDLSGGTVYSTLSKATITFGDEGIIISSSSVWVEGDKMQELEDMDGKIPGVLVLKLPTWGFNPRVTRADLNTEFEKNPEDSARDFGSVRPKAESDAVEMKELVDACIKESRKPLIITHQFIDPKKDPDGVLRKYVKQVADFWPGPERTTLRVLHGDPGKSDDSYVIGLGHLQVSRQPGKQLLIYKTIIDLVVEWEPDPKLGTIVDFWDVANWILKLNQTYTIFSNVLDQWQSEATIQWLRQKGIVANAIAFTQSEQVAMFTTCKNSIYSGQFESYKGDEKSAEQFKHLKRVGNRIDHPTVGKVTDKDRSDCWIGVHWKLVEKLNITAPNLGMRPAAPRISRGGGLDSPRRRL